MLNVILVLKDTHYLPYDMTPKFKPMTSAGAYPKNRGSWVIVHSTWFSPYVLTFEPNSYTRWASTRIESRHSGIAEKIKQGTVGLLEENPVPVEETGDEMIRVIANRVGIEGKVSSLAGSWIGIWGPFGPSHKMQRLAF